MKTQEQILAIIRELQEQREEELNEVANIDETIALREQQLSNYFIMNELQEQKAGALMEVELIDGVIDFWEQQL